MANLEGALPKEYSTDSFSVGDTVGVYDEDLGVDTQVRVISKDVNLKNPIDCQIELSTRPRKAIDILAQHEMDQQQTERRIRRQIGKLLTMVERSAKPSGFVIQEAITSNTGSGFRRYDEYDRWSP